MIGYRDSARAEFLCALRQRLYFDGPIQKTKVGVKMKVDKIFFVHCLFFFAVSEPYSWKQEDRGSNYVARA